MWFSGSSHFLIRYLFPDGWTMVDTLRPCENPWGVVSGGGKPLFGHTRNAGLRAELVAHVSRCRSSWRVSYWGVSYFQPETQKYSNCQNGECSKVWGTVNVTPSELGRRTSIYQASPSPIQDLPKASSERFRVFVRKLRTQDFFHVQRCSVLTCLTFLKQSLTDWKKHGRNWIGQPDRENSWSFWVFACWRASSEHRARGRHLGSHRLCGQCQDHVSSVQDGHVRLQMMTSLQACALACDGPQRFYGMC